MSSFRKILVTTIGLFALGGTLSVGLTGCGQKGPLYKPTDPAAAHRAPLTQTILPTAPANAAASSSLDQDPASEDGPNDRRYGPADRSTSNDARPPPAGTTTDSSKPSSP